MAAAPFSEADTSLSASESSILQLIHRCRKIVQQTLGDAASDPFQGSAEAATSRPAPCVHLAFADPLHAAAIRQELRTNLDQIATIISHHQERQASNPPAMVDRMCSLVTDRAKAAERKDRAVKMLQKTSKALADRAEVCKHGQDKAAIFRVLTKLKALAESVVWSPEISIDEASGAGSIMIFSNVCLLLEVHVSIDGDVERVSATFTVNNVELVDDAINQQLLSAIQSGQFDHLRTQFGALAKLEELVQRYPTLPLFELVDRVRNSFIDLGMTFQRRFEGPSVRYWQNPHSDALARLSTDYSCTCTGLLQTSSNHAGKAPSDASTDSDMKVDAPDVSEMDYVLALTPPMLVPHHVAVALLHGQAPISTGPLSETKTTLPALVRSSFLYCALQRYVQDGSIAILDPSEDMHQAHVLSDMADLREDRSNDTDGMLQFTRQAKVLGATYFFECSIKLPSPAELASNSVNNVAAALRPAVTVSHMSLRQARLPHMPILLGLLQQQAIFNELLHSCMGPACDLDLPSDLPAPKTQAGDADNVFQLNLDPPRLILVETFHPRTDNRLNIHVQIDNASGKSPSPITVKLECSAADRPCSDAYATSVLQKTVSIPLLLHYVMKQCSMRAS